MIVPINSKDELQKVLVIQKIVSETAQKEMIAAAKPEDPAAHVEAEAALLEKYARYPTLTEFRKMSALADGEKWGATFGVTALVGSLVLANAKRLLHTEEDLKYAYLSFLVALDMAGEAVAIDRVTAVFAVLSEQFGILRAQGDALILTVVGRRVVLHLMDAHKFVEEVTKACVRFQPDKIQ